MTALVLVLLLASACDGAVSYRSPDEAVVVSLDSEGNFRLRIRGEIRTPIGTFSVLGPSPVGSDPVEAGSRRPAVLVVERLVLESPSGKRVVYEIPADVSLPPPLLMEVCDPRPV